jgi:hypothetical protein
LIPARILSSRKIPNRDVELQEVRLDDRAVELPADAAEVGEDGGQARQRWVEQLAQLVVLGVLVRFD